MEPARITNIYKQEGYIGAWHFIEFHPLTLSFVFGNDQHKQKGKDVVVVNVLRTTTSPTDEDHGSVLHLGDIEHTCGQSKRDNYLKETL